MLGDKVTAQRALELGMIWQVVPDDQLQQTTTDLAEHLAKQPTYGLSLIKKQSMPRRITHLKHSYFWSVIINALQVAQMITARACRRLCKNVCRSILAASKL